MNYASKQSLIAFEDRIKALWENGDLPTLLHLCGGNEDQLIEIFAEAKEGDWFFSSHRNHYHGLLAGISAADLADSINRGRSMFTFSRARNFLSSAVLAGCCGIAAGVALDIKRSGGTGRVWCFIGEGGIAEGHFWEAINFVEGHGLPCTFVIEDNGRQVDTPKSEQRGPHSQLDDVLALYSCITRYEYTPTYPHAGSGCSHKITFKEEAIERMKSA